jgi:hypothetical protein
MNGLAKWAVKNPQLFGAILGAVIGLVIGVIIDLLFFQAFVRGLVIGFVIGGVLGWWQYKMIMARAGKLLLGRASPL